MISSNLAILTVIHLEGLESSSAERNYASLRQRELARLLSHGARRYLGVCFV